MTLDPPNPLIAPTWRAPPFGRIRPEHFRSALDNILGRADLALKTMAQDSGPATINSVIWPLEKYRAGAENLFYLSRYFLFHFCNPDVERAHEELASRISSFEKSIFQDRAVVARFKSLYERATLSPSLQEEDRNILAYYHQQFEANGAFIDTKKYPEGPARLRIIDERLIALTGRFNTNLMADLDARAVLVTDFAELAGLSADQVANFAAAAAAAGHASGWLITPERRLVATLLRDADNELLQRRLYTACAEVGGAGPHDNRPVVQEIRQLRHEYAQLLGYADYKNFARRRCANQDLQAVELLYKSLAKTVTPAFGRLIDALRDFSGGALNRYNFMRWIARKRTAENSFDAVEFSNHLMLDSVLAGLIDQASRHFDLVFRPVPSERYETPPDIIAYDVVNRQTSAEAVVLIDPYARPGKRGNAWLDHIYDPDGRGPLVVGIALNLIKPDGGNPATLAIAEYRLVYHEWGHLLDAILNQRIKYPSLRNVWNGSADLIEIASMVNEPRGMARQTLRTYALRDGRPPSNDMIDHMLAAEKNFSFLPVLSLLQAVFTDLAFHASGAAEPPEQIERIALMDSAYNNYIRPTPLASFQHLFSVPHSLYAARVDGYLLAEIHSAAIWEKFSETEADDPHWLERLRTMIYGRGIGRDGTQAMTDFLGEAETVEPFLRMIGLST